MLGAAPSRVAVETEDTRCHFNPGKPLMGFRNVALLLSLLFAIGPSAIAAPAQKRPPNVLFFVVDPDGTVNLAADPTNAKLVAELTGKLRANW